MIDDPFDAVPTRRPRVVILFNEPVLAADHPDAESEHEILYTVDAVHETLAKAGYDVARLGVGRDPHVLVAGLRRLQPDVVFNLFEGLADFGSTEAHVAGLLEWAGVPFTGSPYQTLSLARSKHLTKHLLQGAGLPTPDVLRGRGVAGPAVPAGLAGHRQARPAGRQRRPRPGQRRHHAARPQRARRLPARHLRPAGAGGAIHPRPGVQRRRDRGAGPARAAAFGDPVHRQRPRLLADRHLRRQVEARLARLRGDAAALPGRGDAAAAREAGDAGRKAFRLLGCRDYARVDFRVRRRQAVHPRSESEPRLQPDGGPGRRPAVRRSDARRLHVAAGGSAPWPRGRPAGRSRPRRARRRVDDQPERRGESSLAFRRSTRVSHLHFSASRSSAGAVRRADPAGRHRAAAAVADELHRTGQVSHQIVQQRPRLRQQQRPGVAPHVVEQLRALVRRRRRECPPAEDRSSPNPTVADSTPTDKAGVCGTSRRQSRSENWRLYAGCSTSIPANNTAKVAPPQTGQETLR